MTLLTRAEQFIVLYPDAPAFRLRQFEAALFNSLARDFSGISNMSLPMREILNARVPWLSLSLARLLTSVKKDTHKAVVKLGDGQCVETVLMQNARGSWTVCVSSQAGCAMACTFCATGQMGFMRNLLADEIIDQYRFWKIFLLERPALAGRISNIVFMGMGEPLSNYDNVKEAIRQFLAYTDLGQTRITVSTVGLLPMLRKLLNDPKWPGVRLAVSLHSAESQTRKALMPSSFDAFQEELISWTEEYFQKHKSRRQHLTFEYIMLSGVNDTKMHAEALIRFARRVGKARVNLIAYNFIPQNSKQITEQTGSVYRGSLPADFARFEELLKFANVTVTRRRAMGEDIAAACGQLIVEKSRAK
jgi:23S rRNA (adenine2503-C2)-methyltransferase